MMSKSIWIKLLATAGLLFILSGCSFNPLADPKTLIQTPQLPSDKQTLSSLISSELPEGASIQSPKNGNSSKIQTVDLDGDGTSETIVFYQTFDGRINGLIFEKSGDTWVKKDTIEGAGFTLESVEISDITHDGKRDIIVGYSNSGISNSDTGLKTLVIYSYDKGVLKTVSEMPYSYYFITDLDGDGVNELAIATIDKFGDQENLGYVKVTVYRYKNGFQEIDSIDLANSVESFYNTIAGKVTSNQNGIILDEALGVSGLTHLIVMENNELVDVFPRSLLATFKNIQIASEDINNDGILEIGRDVVPEGWENISPTETPRWTYYYQWNGGSQLTKLVSQQYRDDQGRFVIRIAPDWNDKLTIDTKSNKNQDIRFILKDTGEKVAEVRFFSESDWNNHNGDWKVIAQNRGQIIALWENSKINIVQN
ncbi:FG-GAP repeat domain-containing protein [Paenibacillus sp. WLX1005]|uniref:FG-GAP repeat domain-containing protein n=1 Tax=unclassified Paenibacillus TaxID=185978 RepID=UPI0039840EEB